MAQRHEVVAVWLNDPREEELPEIGPLVLEDSETGEQVYVDTRDKGFQERFARWWPSGERTWSTRSRALAWT